MRQVPIEKFKRDMKLEIKALPFEVTRRGKVLFSVNHAVEDKKIQKASLNHVVEVDAQKWINPLLSTTLAPKK